VKELALVLAFSVFAVGLLLLSGFAFVVSLPDFVMDNYESLFPIPHLHNSFRVMR